MIYTSTRIDARENTFLYNRYRLDRLPRSRDRSHPGENMPLTDF